MAAFHYTSADESSAEEKQEDELQQLSYLWQAAIRAEGRRRVRLQRQRMAELADYARAGIEVIPPGSITDCVDADQSPE
jgi:hypothetical protein